MGLGAQGYIGILKFQIVEYHFMVMVVELSSGFTEGLRIYLQTEGLTSCIYGFEGVHIIC